MTALRIAAAIAGVVSAVGMVLALGEERREADSPWRTGSIPAECAAAPPTEESAEVLTEGLTLEQRRADAPASARKRTTEEADCAASAYKEERYERYGWVVFVALLAGAIPLLVPWLWYFLLCGLSEVSAAIRGKPPT